MPYEGLEKLFTYYLRSIPLAVTFVTSYISNAPLRLTILYALSDLCIQQNDPQNYQYQL